ncbi:NAD(P)/FAD-dependent oxidoreductase [Antarcticibacterium flavum]|uniref:NAD(P)/FAD-dependent oxidoreductase n=1 Tax=Antarcticibacterium flavum TaxID=2058175 RepID=A0A5B7X1Y8_9FLAO|nr:MULTISPECIES: FAD-dependent oxidoreductase [Antarcticibacterium]MCM4161340.1 pyridine nucleotide-disulfide oxidoreductase [Antarcticibacterium sp. W02-3]QCY69417.1 NAD(P)/FAD-dependent oxidoreductase [Antarcticibacterium flavum]
MNFEVMIVGAGAAGLSCALVLGSAKEKSYAQNHSVGIIAHQKASHLQSAVINNALGITPGTTGAEILREGLVHLEKLYPQVVQISREKVIEISVEGEGIRLRTNKNSYKSKIIVVAVGYTDLMKIKGLESYIIPHKKSPSAKNRIQLKNEDHLVLPGLYVAGTLAGHRSQYAIACGSGAAVATDILTLWNDGEHTKVHDKLE